MSTVSITIDLPITELNVDDSQSSIKTHVKSSVCIQLRIIYNIEISIDHSSDEVTISSIYLREMTDFEVTTTAKTLELTQRKISINQTQFDN